MYLAVQEDELGRRSTVGFIFRWEETTKILRYIVQWSTANTFLS